MTTRTMTPGGAFILIRQAIHDAGAAAGTLNGLLNFEEATGVALPPGTPEDELRQIHDRIYQAARDLAELGSEWIASIETN